MGRSWRILLIDDDAHKRAALVASLQHILPHSDVELVLRERDLTQALRGLAPDLVISTTRMPWMAGAELVRTIKMHWPACPVLVVAVTGQEAEAIALCQAGADDYIAAFAATPFALAIQLAEIRATRPQQTGQALQRLLSFLDRVELGVFQATLEGQLLEADAVFRQIFALPALPLPLASDLQMLGLWPATMLLQRLGTGEVIRQRELYCKRANGQGLWVALTAVQRATPTGELVIDGLVEDMTAQRRLAIQAQQAQRIEAVTAMAGGIAHDFNNILSAIMGYTELTLEDMPLESMAWHNLQAVLTASRRARDLVQQILTFSRQTHTDRQPVRLHLVLRDVLQRFQATLPATIVIHQQGIEDAGMILADPGQMQQVLTTLCANAEYAMRHVGGILEAQIDAVTLTDDQLDSLRDLEAGRYLRCRIRYSGDAMRLPVQESGEGTGIGLALVDGLVTSNHGAMTVSTVSGQGTTIALYFPQMEAALEKAVRPLPLPEEQDERRLDVAKMRILLVEDDAGTRGMLKQMLERAGYDITEARDGEEGLRLYRQAPPDLIITDILMPEKEGLGLIRELQREQPRPKIIAISGGGHTGMLDFLHVAERLGAQRTLHKPVQQQDLLAAVQSVLAMEGEGD